MKLSSAILGVLLFDALRREIVDVAIKMTRGDNDALFVVVGTTLDGGVQLTAVGRVGIV